MMSVDARICAYRKRVEARIETRAPARSKSALRGQRRCLTFTYKILLDFVDLNASHFLTLVTAESSDRPINRFLGVNTKRLPR